MGVSCAKRRGAPDRQPILVKGRQVVGGGFCEPALPFEQPAKAEVGFREARMPRENRLIPGGGRFGIARFAGTRCSRTHGQPLSLCRGNRGRQSGSVRLDSGPHWLAERSGSAERRSGHSRRRSLPTAVRKSATISSDSQGLQTGGSMRWWRPESGGASIRFRLTISRQRRRNCEIEAASNNELHQPVPEGSSSNPASRSSPNRAANSLWPE